MKRLLILVEGQTEETFVRDVLSPHLSARSIHAIPVLLKTKRVKSGGAFRGGVTSTEQVLGDIRRLLGDSGARAVTTILDYYALPDDFPGMQTRPGGGPHLRVAHVEQALGNVFQGPRFIPNLVLHEYETWIYSEPQATRWVFDDAGVPGQLERIRALCGGAELIDEGPTTAPSKRLLNVFPPYRKTLHGPLAVGAIGLAAVRHACPHADAWLTQLESL